MIMVYDRGIEFEDSASKHGYTLDDVIYATRHHTKMYTYTVKDATYNKLTGPYQGDALVSSLEIILKRDKTGRVHVFHVNAEQDGFFDRD